MNSALPTSKPLESVLTSLYLGPSASSANFTITSASGFGHSGVQLLGANTTAKDGSWEFEPQKQVGRACICRTDM